MARLGGGGGGQRAGVWGGENDFLFSSLEWKPEVESLVCRMEEGGRVQPESPL